MLSAAFIEELGGVDAPADVDGYRARFRYCIEGVPLRGTLYLPVTVLFRRQRARYTQDGHAQRVQLSGAVRQLTTPLLHDDRKPLARWFDSQMKYMEQEAIKLRTTPFAGLGWPDRVRKLVVVAPVAAFLYCMLVKGNLFDGRRGLMYALQRATAEAMLSLYLVEAALRLRRTDES